MPVNLIPLSPCLFIAEDLVEMKGYQRLGIERYVIGRQRLEIRCPFGEEFRDNLIELASLRTLARKENKEKAKELGWEIKYP